MEKINAWRESVMFDGTEYNITIIEDGTDGNTYDVYVDTKDYAMVFMFGIPKDQATLEEAFEIGKENLPDYIEDIFGEE